jgi:tRNA G46 methylase TrmB
MVIANVEMAAAWDGAEGDHWTVHADRYEAAAAGYWRALLAAVPSERDAVVLDIGCGTGRSTRDVARTASSGSVVGLVDVGVGSRRARPTPGEPTWMGSARDPACASSCA